ncbi:hypothetical protein J6590_012927 [Homalodisca vitripennis]|nr:hypothetical protein J6590_012927 [Homalodisca vitripennis]
MTVINLDWMEMFSSNDDGGWCDQGPLFTLTQESGYSNLSAVSVVSLTSYLTKLLSWEPVSGIRVHDSF